MCIQIECLADCTVTLSVYPWVWLHCSHYVCLCWISLIACAFLYKRPRNSFSFNYFFWIQCVYCCFSCFLFILLSCTGHAVKLQLLLTPKNMRIRFFHTEIGFSFSFVRFLPFQKKIRSKREHLTDYRADAWKLGFCMSIFHSFETDNKLSGIRLSHFP